MSTGDKGGEYIVAVAGPQVVSWEGYADNAYDALNKVALLMETGEVKPE